MITIGKTNDYIVRATAADGAVRAFAMTSRDTVEEARKRHGTAPTVTAALGRLMTGGAMMGAMMKSEDDLLTLQIKSAGPVKGMTLTADFNGNVKGYPIVPDVMVPASDKGKLDVGRAAGPGELLVIKDLGLKEPYVGQVMLQSGEIAEDLTYYFAASEQVPSSVGLGVLMNKDNTVRRAGGFIIQLMPEADEAAIAKLEENLSGIPPVTTMLDNGLTPETMLEKVLEGLNPAMNETIPARFFCNCSRERVERVLFSVGKEELQDMIDDGEPVEIKCHFCNTAYTFSIDEIKEIKAR